MQRTSRSMIFTGPNSPLESRSIALPTLKPGEALVRISLSTICGSDLHTYQGKRSTPCPTILGHEMVGIVDSISEENPPKDHRGTVLEAGDRVIWSIMASCGECFFCRKGLPQKCHTLFKYGHERIDEHRRLSGGLSEYCHILGGTTLVKVPDTVKDEAACPAGCATATTAAAFRRAGDCRNSVVLIQGAGALGLTACAFARRGGAKHVLVSDVDYDRLSMAQRFGATEGFDVSAGVEELVDWIFRITEGRGVDVIFEMSGAPTAFSSGFDLLRIGGRYILVGAVFPAPPEPAPLEKIVRRMLTITGVHNYGPEDLVEAMSFLERHCGEFPFDELVTRTFPLEHANRAFEYAVRQPAIRVAVQP